MTNTEKALREENQRLITLTADQGRELQRIAGLNWLLGESIKKIQKLAGAANLVTNKGTSEEKKKLFKHTDNKFQSVFGVDNE